MIIFDLSCQAEHRFEGWFQDKDDMQAQLSEGLLRCPVCESEDIRKLPTMAKFNKSSNRASSSTETAVTAAPAPGTTNNQAMAYAASQEFARKLHDYVDTNFTDVGTRFAEEARKIHSGEREDAGIRGIASAEQVKELNEEGIETVPLPAKPIDKNRLN